jgi:Tautomerase enzyme
MPLAKIHVLEGRYDQSRIAKISSAIQSALINTLRVPPEDFFQLIFELPKNRFLHTSSFVGMHYSDDLIILEIAFIQGRPKETRLALLKEINTRIAAAAGILPDDVMTRYMNLRARTFHSVRARRSASYICQLKE